MGFDLLSLVENRAHTQRGERWPSLALQICGVAVELVLYPARHETDFRALDQPACRLPNEAGGFQKLVECPANRCNRWGKAHRRG